MKVKNKEWISMKFSLHELQWKNNIHDVKCNIGDFGLPWMSFVQAGYYDTYLPCIVKGHFL